MQQLTLAQYLVTGILLGAPSSTSHSKLVAAEDAPTLADIEGLAPRVAGAIVLRGRTHSPIVAVHVLPRGGMDPPGYFERHFLEQPVASALGCIKRGWRAAFLQTAEATTASAQLSSVSSFNQISLHETGGCSATQFVRLQPGVNPEHGLRLLARLHAIRTGRINAAFACLDSTGSNLCRNRRSIMRGLASSQPWLMGEEGQTAYAALGTPGQTVTMVRFNLDQENQVQVHRRIPAPF